MTEEIPTGELCDRYAELYPGAATDVLDAREKYEVSFGDSSD